ncbi:hypothetical protein IP69_08740 [Bosea sp. AAP35]|nr:hypothetical protein IP69_08740 [Bosea sp. AAP35]
MLSCAVANPPRLLQRQEDCFHRAAEVSRATDRVAGARTDQPVESQKRAQPAAPMLQCEISAAAL